MQLNSFWHELAAAASEHWCSFENAPWPRSSDSSSSLSTFSAGGRACGLFFSVSPCRFRSRRRRRSYLDAFDYNCLLEAAWIYLIARHSLAHYLRSVYRTSSMSIDVIFIIWRQCSAVQRIDRASAETAALFQAIFGAAIKCFSTFQAQLDLVIASNFLVNCRIRIPSVLRRNISRRIYDFIIKCKIDQFIQIYIRHK